jgi:hypothetical protein
VELEMDMVEGPIPPEMRKPRQIRRARGYRKGWFYIDPASISVYVGTEGDAVSVKLPRAQLEAALRVMQKYDPKTE